MHGPLICHECRIFLKEDEEHEKEQQAYEDRRQAKYAAQIAGTNNKTTTDNKEYTQEEQHNNEGTYDVVPSPSPPRELPQNFTRVTLAQVFILGLQDAKVVKQKRQDGHVLQQRPTPIPLHLNRFACLHEIQDTPPIPRWTERTIQFQIAYLQQRQTAQKRTSGHATTPNTLLDKTVHQTSTTQLTRQQYRQHVTTITVPKKANNNTEDSTSTSLVGGRTTTTTTTTRANKPPETQEKKVLQNETNLKSRPRTQVTTA
jgi:hypothetical protein